jgi:hypothetical protein
MNKFILTLLVAFLGVNLHAQTDNIFAKCGAPSFKSPWLTKYQENPDKFEQRFNDTLYVPITINIIGDDNGQARMADLGVLAALNTLNTDFKEAMIQFYLPSVVNHEFYSKWNEHETVLDGADMMFELNVENTFNCYFLKDGAGNCGYNLPYAGLVVSNNCANVKDHTWAHEFGHGFSLPHPFLGWEGGQTWDGTMPPNYSNPAPEKVTFDYTYFKDTLIRDTMIIDTVYVERVDGSNCSFAADGFCDTPPDYLAFRWPCTASNTESTQEQTDPVGEKFRSDGTLIMSYADDKCAARFSAEQIGAMRANLIDQKSNLLYNQTPKEPIGEFSMDLIEPFFDEKVYYKNIELSWTPVDSADYYLVQFSKYSGFQIVSLDTIVASTDMVMPKLEMDKKYYWRVMPFNTHNFDFIFSEGSTFTTSVLSNIQDISNEIICKPTILSSGEAIEIYLDSGRIIEQINIFNLQGELVSSYNNIDSNKLLINEYLHKGMYIVNINAGTAVGTAKIIVQ